MPDQQGAREPTHYDVLGVAPSAPPADVRRAFLVAARRHHPDYHVDDGPEAAAAAEEAMRKVNAAWAVLKRPELRGRYDEQLRILGIGAPPSPARSRSRHRRQATGPQAGASTANRGRADAPAGRRGLGWVLLVLGLAAASGGLALAQPLLLVAGFVTAVAAGIVVSFAPAGGET